jgi:hypothetical protein
VKTGRGIRQGCTVSLLLLNFCGKYLTNESVEWFGNFKIGKQIICSVKYADDLVLLAKEEAVLQGVTNRLIKVGRCYGMEWK